LVLFIRMLNLHVWCMSLQGTQLGVRVAGDWYTGLVHLTMTGEGE
jgi:hypothetical protein